MEPRKEDRLGLLAWIGRLHAARSREKAGRDTDSVAQAPQRDQSPHAAAIGFPYAACGIEFAHAAPSSHFAGSGNALRDGPTAGQSGAFDAHAADTADLAHIFGDKEDAASVPHAGGQHGSNGAGTAIIPDYVIGDRAVSTALSLFDMNRLYRQAEVPPELFELEYLEFE